MRLSARVATHLGDDGNSIRAEEALRVHVRCLCPEEQMRSWSAERPVKPCPPHEGWMGVPLRYARTAVVNSSWSDTRYSAQDRPKRLQKELHKWARRETICGVKMKSNLNK